MKKHSMIFVILASFSCLIFAANPNATYREALYDSQIYGDGSPDHVFLFFVYIGSIIIGGWLLFSSRSPMARVFCGDKKAEKDGHTLQAKGWCSV
ncbi:hypothetical protein [Marinobacter panjinensis]|uniref:hypothetical protein n=1 Tax=Marinobacter panjinensis TaxID=2576384 RepID=UPI001485C063|nr:hypothetical protein [Marinobacter panjinensis]